MKINWGVRLRNKAWWITIIPAILLLVQLVADMLGYHLDLGDLGNKIIEIVNVVFIVLALTGVVNDPTTQGLEDSTRAMGYEIPFLKNEEEYDV